jgi:hypothetical protein
MLFRPIVVVAVSVIVTVAFVLLMFPLPRFAGERRWYLLAYHAPIAIVFVCYLFDRTEHRRQIHVWQWIVESLVVSVALVRAVFSIPHISGHALFLSYLLVTTAFRLTWWLALLVFAEVVYLKVLAWGDPTLIGGVIGGVLGGVAMWWGKRFFGKRT